MYLFFNKLLTDRSIWCIIDCKVNLYTGCVMKQTEKTEITKNKIFAAAIREFGSKGYEAGAVNNICKTGINKGLIYHNFKDKDELYIRCVKKCCRDLIDYIVQNGADNSFIEYMDARMKFFHEFEDEACLFISALTNPPSHLIKQIKEIYAEFDRLNIAVFEKELSALELRDTVTEQEALNYFVGIQKIYNLSFAAKADGAMSACEQVELHELNIRRLFDLMLYGIAKGGN